LALARESLLFRYDEKEKVFQGVVEDMRISGYSQESWRSLTYDFLAYGSSVRQAVRFASDVRSSNKASSTCIALASGISTILSALEARLSQPLVDTRTVLGVQSLLEQPTLLLKAITEIIGQVRSFGDDSVPSLLFNLCQTLEYSAPWCRPVFDQLMVRVSQPWMDSAEVFLGLREAHGPSTMTMESTAIANRQLAVHSTSGDLGAPSDLEGQTRSHRPTFVPDELAQMLLETEQSLNVLRESEPDNPLADVSRLSSLKPPSLQLAFTFEALDENQARTQTYESRVLQALKEFDASGTFRSAQEPSNSDLIEPINSFSDPPSHLSILLKQMEDPLPSMIDPNSSSLIAAVCDSLDSTSPVPHGVASPPLSLSATLSLRPLVLAQSRVLAHSTLRLLFRIHRLRFHLRLLHSYPLFANGPFLVRLSHALFDSSLSSAAYQKGRIRSTTGTAGLKLGTRETWPPASSELRIALMGVLTDSYFSSVLEKDRISADGGLMNRGDLPGDLSFAIRHDMSDSELDKCMDVNGLEALDFLKIAYKPPKPLDAVITNTALEKYDSISRLLLRGARVGFVVKELMQHRRGAAREKSIVQRFKIEARHFVTTIFGFFADSIAELWSTMEDRLDRIEGKIDCYEIGVDLEGIHRLRALHEEILDRILAACLLRKRQEKVMNLLEEILRIVLDFAGKSKGDTREHQNSMAKEKENDIENLYHTFRKKVKLFITVCKGLQDQKSITSSNALFIGGRRENEMGNGIGRLVLRFEMNERTFASPLADAHYPKALETGTGGLLNQIYDGLNGYSAVITFFLLLVAYDQFKYIWNKGSIVGPAWKMPFIGPFLSSVNPKMDEYKAKWASGELSCVSVFHKFVVIASSRDMARKVFNSPAFVKPCVVDVAQKLLRPANWVFLDGRAHVDYRKGLNGLFTRQALETYLPGQEEVYDKYFAKFLDISQKQNGGKPVPYMPVFRELMCAVSCRTFVGHYMSDAAVKKVADDYYKITAALELVNFPFIIPYTRTWYGKKAADMVLNEFSICAAKSKARMAAGGDITCIMDGWILSMLNSEKYRQKIEKGIAVDDSEKPAMLLRVFSDFEISMTIFTFLFASQDATSSASTWLFQLMADRPEILDRVREENLAVRNGNRDQRFSMDILENMPYTRAVVKETLRYRPPVIMVPYVAKKSFPVTPNYTAPKGSMVIPSVWPALHDPEVYPQPDYFDPERWISGDAEKAVKNWLVFGTGPHYCLGQTYAQLNLMAMIGKASMHLDWKHHTTPISEDIKVFATIFPMDDCPLVFSKRD
ncbi:MAG: hypothetical protein Q9174_005012, partial [Haloplaca sp. 1 TL-2023]